MYEEDEIERWRRGGRRRNPGENAMVLHSAPSLSASSTNSTSSFKSNRSTSSASWRSWKSRCTKTGEYCAAGHELIRIPVVDRQRHLQRKEMLLQQQDQQLQQQRFQHPYDAPLTVTPRELIGDAPSCILIECDCCSRNIMQDQYIAGCCLECDIDVCGDCFKNGQSYIDVVLAESRHNDMSDDLQQQIHQQNYQHHERYNGRRPTYIGTGRVNYDHYPDPTAFQWSFTGSNCDENDVVVPVEYFEKDFGKEVGVIRLDFYYTIGTVQTTIVDPIRGTVRELFTKSQDKMSQQSYRKILKDPRSYNNERYKKGAPSLYDLNYHYGRQRQQVL